MWSMSVRNVSEIELFPAKILKMSLILHPLRYAVTLTFDPLTLNLRGTSAVAWTDSVHNNLSKIDQSSAESLMIYYRYFVVSAVGQNRNGCFERGIICTK